MTRLEEIKSGSEFPYGQIINICEIGSYAIVEYHPWLFENFRAIVGVPDKEKLSYCGFIGGNGIIDFWDDVDSALVGLVARKRDGYNSPAAKYFLKMTATN